MRRRKAVRACICVAVFVANTGSIALSQAAAPLEEIRQIVVSMTPGEWRELPNTRMQDVWPKREGHPAWGVHGPRAITDAFGGGAFDTKRNVFVVTGGGHNAYGGNEVYHFSLETLRWTRATEPSAVAPLFGDDGKPDGRYAVIDGSEAPVSSHTYDGLQYLPNVDRVFKWGGAYYTRGSPYDRHAYLYDPEARRWKRGAANPWGAAIEVASAYFPSTGEVLVSFQTGLIAYDPVADRWREVTKRDGWYTGNVVELDPARETLVSLGNFKSPGFAIQTMEPVSRRQLPPVIGEAAPELAFRSAGLALHSPTRRFVVWPGDREIWTIDADNWRATRLRNPNGLSPSAFNSKNRKKFAGIYGRWQYVPALDVFLGYGSGTDNVWLYKLPARTDH